MNAHTNKTARRPCYRSRAMTQGATLSTEHSSPDVSAVDTDWWAEGCKILAPQTSATRRAVEDAMVTGIRAACEESMTGSLPLIAFSASAFAASIATAEHLQQFAAGASHVDLLAEIDAVCRVTK